MNYLQATYFFDYNHTAIQQFIAPLDRKEFTAKEKAIQLYFKIRDGWRYNPSIIEATKEGWRSSFILSKPEGHCLDKSILFVSGLRGLGIPARLHLAKVINHIGVEQIIERFGIKELTPHGMVDVCLNSIWLKNFSCL